VEEGVLVEGMAVGLSVIGVEERKEKGEVKGIWLDIPILLLSTSFMVF